MPVALQKEVKNKILELKEEGIIKEAVEPSEWISNMVIVAKPQKIRICLDPKRPEPRHTTPQISNADVWRTVTRAQQS